jgi:hypothetical protein
MVISKKQQTATLNDIDLKLVEKNEYLGVILNNSMNYSAQWEVISSKTNPHIYLLKKLRRMGFTEDKLVCICKSLTLSQYIYGAPLLASASTIAKKEMQAQQRLFLNVIGISTERAMRQHRTKNPQRPEPSPHDGLAESLRIIRDGYVNKYTNLRRIETTTAAYKVEINSTKKRPKTKQHTLKRQPTLFKPHHQPSASSVYSKPKYQWPKNTQQQNA